MANSLYRSGLLVLLVVFAVEAQALPFEESAFTGREELVLEGVLIRGNWNVTDEAILDLLGWKVGSPFDEKTLAAGQTRMEASELFRTIELSTRKGNEPGTVIVLVRVREKRLPYLIWLEARMYEYGYSFNFLELETHTADRASHLTLKVQMTDPWTMLWAEGSRRMLSAGTTRLFLSGMAGTRSWNVYPLPHRDGYIFSVSRMEAALGMQFSHPTPGRVRLGGYTNYTSVNDKPTIYKDDREIGDRLEDRSLLPPQLRDPNDAAFSGVEFSLMKDKRDHDLFPHDGFLFYLPVRYSYNHDDATSFTRVELSAMSYMPLPKGRTLALLGRAGMISGDAPYYERFSLEVSPAMYGIDSGWTLTPYGGTTMWMSTVELRMPLGSSKPDSFLQLLLFSSAGAAWNDDSKMHSKDPDYSRPTLSFGWGLSFRLPAVGPLVARVGYPVIAPDNAAGVNFTVDLGMAF